MDTVDAFLRLHHAAGNAGWLRDALQARANATGEPCAGGAWRPEQLLSAPVGDWLAAGAPIGTREVALGPDAGRYAASVQAWLRADPAHTLLGWHDTHYPSLLRDIANPPTALFVHGHAERLWWPQVAVVGSRAPTPSGRERAMRWTRAFADAGFVVTSGLAAGVDAAAHAAALAEPGTIAVTATGPDRCFPAAHRRLQADIALHGAVVTEHPPGTEARPAHFPSRNRIIAGLSLATVVVEAAHRSGALITARLAAETGREVFALPGAPENLKARGCHRLIRDGATLVDEPSQVVDALTASTGEAIGRLRAVLHAPRRPSCADGPAAFACTDAERVWRSLGPEGAHFDELLLRAGLTSATLAPILLAMELEGRLTQQHGVYLPCGSAPPRRAGSQRRR
jgi:DNA processing protein